MALITTSYAKTPKYWKWTEEMRRRIQEGELQPGDQLPSFAEMKSRHGVSRPLVERMQSLLEADGLIVRERGRGVFVAPAAASQPEDSAEKSGGMLGCLSFEITSARQQRKHRVYWSHLLGGIEDAARQAGRQLLLFDHFSPGDAWEKVDGVLTTGGKIPNLLPGIPSVCLLHSANGITNIVADNAGGVRLAIRHLRELGHQRIGSLFFTDDQLSFQKQYGYETGLREAGIAVEAAWQRSLTEPEEHDFDFMLYGERRVATWLEEDWRSLGLTALVCENDQTAIGAIAAFRKAGIEVPRDVSVVGFDGTEISKYSHPALTTIEVPLDEIGRRGVQELLLQIDGQQSTVREVVLPTQLKVRESTAPVTSG